MTNPLSIRKGVTSRVIQLSLCIAFASGLAVPAQAQRLPGGQDPARVTQSLLSAAGIYQGSVDGIVGHQTRVAIDRSLAMNGRPMTASIADFLQTLQGQIRGDQFSRLQTCQRDLRRQTRTAERSERRLTQLAAQLANSDPDRLEALGDEIEACNAVLAELEQQNATLRSTIATASTPSETVPSPELEAARDAATETARQLSAANTTIADLQSQVAVLQDSNAALNVARAEIAALQHQLQGANESLADLRTQMSTDFVPIADHANVSAQLVATNQTIADLRADLTTDYVPRGDHLNVTAQLVATNQTIADLHADMAANYVPRGDHMALERQVAALNATLAEQRSQWERQRQRLQESEALFRNFRDDCAAQPDCARAMHLE